MFEAGGFKVDRSKAPTVAKPRKLTPAEVDELREGAKRVKSWGPEPTIPK